MKNNPKRAIIGTSFVLGILLLASLVLADTTTIAPAAGGPALPPSSSTDSDQDGLSDYDEAYIYGTNPLRESTDGDAYDDGQEILGFSPANYGNLGGQMPSYVKWPGSSPFAAAYPQVDFSVDNSFTVFIHKELHFANRTMVNVERTTGTIVTSGVSTSYGVGGSHTVGGYQDAINTVADAKYASDSQSQLTGKQAITSQTDEYSKSKTDTYGISADVGIDSGAKLTLQPSWSGSETATNKVGHANSIGTNVEVQQGNSIAIEKRLERTERTGNISSATTSATNSVTLSTFVSSVNLYTVGTAEEWETGWSQDTLDAAKLRFGFDLKNTGTDRTVGISGLRFTIKIGPYAKTYPDLTQSGITLPALNPGETRHYNGEISLTLDELHEFDTKGKVQIYIEDYDLGSSNEEAYALSAYEGGTLFIVDDGSKDDGSNLQYYLPHVEPYDTYGNIVSKLNQTIPVGSPQYFQKVLDVVIVNDTITSIAGFPVSENAAWFIQTEGLSNQPFLFKEAKRGSKVIMTYSKDSDWDNYPDRAERRVGANVNDANSHPNPNVIAGYYIENITVVGDNVSFERAKPVIALRPIVANIGNYDAYGAEVRLVATTSAAAIVDGFAGGSVRIKPNETFALTDTVSWSPSAPAVKSNRNFMLNNRDVAILDTANSDMMHDGDMTTSSSCQRDFGGQRGCFITLPDGELLHKIRTYSAQSTLHSVDISADNKTWTRIGSWQDGNGGGPGWKEFSFGDIPYVKYILIRGRDSGGALTVNELELYAVEYNGKLLAQVLKPVLETLYNDPQGPHRFVSDLRVADENASIGQYAAEMKHGLSLVVSGPAKLTYGSSDSVGIDFVNSHNATIEGGKIYAAYQLLNGTMLKTFTQSANFAQGSSHFDFNLNTAEFGTEIIGQEVVVLAVAADYQGIAIAEQIETIEIENPVKIVNYAPGDVPFVIKFQRGEQRQFAVFASATSQLAYKWFLDGVQIAGAAASAYDAGNVQTGNHTLEVEASDGTYSNSHIWQLEVTQATNNPPTLQPLADITVTAGQDAIVRPAAADTDNDTLAFAFSGSLNFTELANQTFVVTPHVSGTYPMALTVSDGNGGIASDNFTVYVNAQVPQNNTTSNIATPSNPGGSGNSGAGGGGGGSDSTPKCNIGYELKNGKCVLKESAPARVDGQNLTATATLPEKPRINVQPQTAYHQLQTETKSGIVSGLLTAVKAKAAIFGAIIMLALASGYYLFTRKDGLGIEFGDHA